MAKIFCKNVADIPGTFKDYAGGAVPANYLACDGSTVSQTTYKALFAAIGTTFNIGGEAAGTFRLPDCRRRVVIGAGGTKAYSGTGSVGVAVGNSGGEETHTLAAGTSEIPAHSHSVVPYGTPGFFTFYTIPSVGGAGNLPAGWANGSLSGAVVPGDNPAVHMGSAGGGGAHNNMQPSLVVTKIIKY